MRRKLRSLFRSNFTPRIATCETGQEKNREPVNFADWNVLIVRLARVECRPKQSPIALLRKPIEASQFNLETRSPELDRSSLAGKRQNWRFLASSL